MEENTIKVSKRKLAMLIRNYMKINALATGVIDNLDYLNEGSTCKDIDDMPDEKVIDLFFFRGGSNG